MKTLQELSVDELRKLHDNNEQFEQAVLNEAYERNMEAQADEFEAMGAKLFDYHDHYSSFYLTTPQCYGVKDGHAIANKLDGDYMSFKARGYYDELCELADKYDNMTCDELEEQGVELDDKMNTVCDKLAEQLTEDFRTYETVEGEQIQQVLDEIHDGWSHMSEWETDGTTIYEHITKEYR